jgi:hypothetical protein
MMLGREEVQALQSFVTGGPWIAVKDETIRELCRMYLAVLDAPEVSVLDNGCRVNPPRQYGRLLPDSVDEFGMEYAATTFLGQFIGQRVRILPEPTP